MRKCRSNWSGVFGIPYYRTPPVTGPDVMGGLAVWRHKNKTKIHKKTKIGLLDEEANACENVVVADGLADVRTSAAMTDDVIDVY